MPENESPQGSKKAQTRSRPIKTASVVSDVPDSSSSLDSIILALKNYAMKKVDEGEATLITFCVVTSNGQVGGAIIDKEPNPESGSALSHKVAEVGGVFGLTSLIHKLSDATME